MSDYITFVEFVNQQSQVDNTRIGNQVSPAQVISQQGIPPQQPAAAEPEAEGEAVMGSQFRDKLVEIITSSQSPQVIAKLFGPIFQAVMQKDPNIISRLKNQGVNMNKNLQWQIRNTNPNPTAG